MKRPPVWIRVLACLIAIALVAVYFHTSRRGHHILNVHAEPGFNAQAMLQTQDGGMAQYGIALQQSASQTATLQALSNWNSYIQTRCGWVLSSTNVNRLATADWNARQAGAPNITAQQVAAAANQLIANQLATMSASQQTSLAKQMFSTSTPKGVIGLNPDYKYVTATKNPDGTYSAVIDPSAFSDMKSNMASLAPGMFSNSTNFYPSEVMLVGYSVATWDMGYGNAYVTKVKGKLTDITGLDMTNNMLYGQSGYLIRRPVTTFLTDAAIGRFFTSLGF